MKIPGRSGVTRPRSVVIVGAGLAGSRCAETLRAAGFDGELVLVGDESFPPYERPALSKEFLAGSRETDDLLLRPRGFWESSEIQLRLGEHVVALDCAVGTATTDACTLLHWDALVLATGARPRRLPFPTPPGVHHLRTLADARVLRRELMPDRRLAVIGGGFVGAEVASTARALGLEVNILEAGSAPFARLLGTEIGTLLRRRYEQFGVEVRTNAAVTGFRTDGEGRVSAVTLAAGVEVACDLALVAVGVEPADDLHAQGTAAGTVYACGDAVGGPGHWASAAESGASAARALLGLDPGPPSPPFFWSDQFGLRLQLVGDPSAGRTIEVDGNEERFVTRYLDPDGELVAALAANRPETVARFRRELAFAA